MPSWHEAFSLQIDIFIKLEFKSVLQSSTAVCLHRPPINTAVKLTVLTNALTQKKIKIKKFNTIYRTLSYNCYFIAVICASEQFLNVCCKSLDDFLLVLSLSNKIFVVTKASVPVDNI